MLDSFDLINLHPQKQITSPIRLTSYDIYIRFDVKTLFSIAYYESRTGRKVVREFDAAELHFKLQFLNDLVPGYINLNIIEFKCKTCTVIVQDEATLTKQSYDYSFLNGHKMEQKIWLIEPNKEVTFPSCIN